jgi:pimeloyl-ACP methyl ester carboxylesterase
MPEYEGDGGARLHYDVVGGGPGEPVIVLAGGAARHPEYLGDLGGLGERRPLVVPHLRGVGGSGGAEPRSWWAQAADIERLRQELGSRRVALVGHSAGTRLAVAYAARFGGGLAGLVLITPPASYLVDVPDDVPALVRARMGEPRFAAAMAAWDAGPAALTEQAFNAWQLETAPIAFATWDDAAAAHAATGTYSLAANRAYMNAGTGRC